MVHIPEKTKKKGTDKKQFKKITNRLVDSPAAGEADETSSSKALIDDGTESAIEGEGQSSPSAKEKAGEKKTVSRDRKEFFENTVINMDDVGKTLLRKIEETESSADEVTELSETEEKFLNDLLFNGYTSHLLHLKDSFPIRFRSAAANVPQRGFDILAEEKGSKQKLQGVEACMLVSIYLECYGVQGSLYFSHESKTPEEFGSEEAIKERFNFVKNKVSSIITDAMLSRLHEFLDLLKRVSLSRNIVNF